jgi:hypothetical protein
MTSAASSQRGSLGKLGQHLRIARRDRRMQGGDIQ